MNPVLRALFFATFLGLLASGHVFLYRRLVRDVTTDRRARLAGRAGFGLLFALLFLGPFLSIRLGTDWAQSLAMASWTWLGLAMYLALTVGALSLAVRLARAREKKAAPALLPAPEAVDLARRQFMSRAVAGSALLASSGVVSYGSWRAFRAPEVTDVAVKLRGLPRALDGFRILQLSDVHVGSVIRDRFVDEVVAQCRGLRPDALVITGDLMDGSVQRLGATVSRLLSIAPRYGSYFCTGNHEYYSGDEEWCAALEKMGVRTLRNRFVPVGDGTHSFDLIGVDDWSAAYDLGRALTGRDPERASVLLAHQPAGFDEAAKKGIGLQLSGHTHGGQMFPMTELVRLRWPYSAGRYARLDSTLYVSRGTGFWGPPMRIGSPPEVVRLTLTAG